MQRFFRAVWPLVLWMALVFVASTEVGSASHTGRIIGPLLRWFDPSISEATIAHVHFLVRKTGHVTEYAILAIVLLRALRMIRQIPVARWSWNLAFLSFCGSAAYAASDEIHQIFVPSRGPSIGDVLIDSCGALVGLMIAYWWKRSRHSEAATLAGTV